MVKNKKKKKVYIPEVENTKPYFKKNRELHQREESGKIT